MQVVRRPDGHRVGGGFVGDGRPHDAPGGRDGQPEGGRGDGGGVQGLVEGDDDRDGGGLVEAAVVRVAAGDDGGDVGPGVSRGLGGVGALAGVVDGGDDVVIGRAGGDVVVDVGRAGQAGDQGRPLATGVERPVDVVGRGPGRRCPGEGDDAAAEGLEGGRGVAQGLGGDAGEVVEPGHVERLDVVVVRRARRQAQVGVRRGGGREGGDEHIGSRAGAADDVVAVGVGRVVRPGDVDPGGGQVGRVGVGRGAGGIGASAVAAPDGTDWPRGIGGGDPVVEPDAAGEVRVGVAGDRADGWPGGRR